MLKLRSASVPPSTSRTRRVSATALEARESLPQGAGPRPRREGQQHPVVDLVGSDRRFAVGRQGVDHGAQEAQHRTGAHQDRRFVERRGERDLAGVVDGAGAGPGEGVGATDGVVANGSPQLDHPVAGNRHDAVAQPVLEHRRAQEIATEPVLVDRLRRGAVGVVEGHGAHDRAAGGAVVDVGGDEVLVELRVPRAPPPPKCGRTRRRPTPGAGGTGAARCPRTWCA